MVEQLPDGLYERIESRGLEKILLASPELQPELARISDSDLTESLSSHVFEILRAKIDRAAELSDKVALVNGVLQHLGENDQLITSRVHELLAINRSSIGVAKLPRPSGRLSVNSLITNARGDASIGAEIAAELQTADSVDLLCAFVRWTGIRVLEDALLSAKAKGIQFRVLTTTYMGATERKALDRLVRDYGAEVRISYEIQSTRLHAKAWLFNRNSGLSTAYIGSSNLSRAAMLDGLEWNVRVSQVRDDHILDKFKATFGGYWNSGQFRQYDPDRDAQKLDDALAKAGSNDVRAADAPINLAGIEVTARPHQSRILEALEAEREIHDRHRNLVVAATGTGKTVVAALDFKRLLQRHGDLSLLFVAHRKEILEQSMRMFREVLADGSFGELYVAGSKPTKWRHVFASVQGLSSFGIEQLDLHHFDVVIVDEFHHAEAKSYRRLLEYLRPVELLGLTATPERADGVNVADFFDGRIAAELRLWDALEQDLLVPFHYFGVSDDIDLRYVQWTRGTYDVAGLDGLYTGNDARAAKVIRELRDKSTDIAQIRALGFCVSINHAQYMARVFNRVGIRARAISGESSQRERDEALSALRRRDINCLFTVDLINEGLDIPQIDTVLFLRPTQSATIFLQQLGRGLRRADDKAVLTVLDFVGQQRQEFRFDLKLRALTGSSRKDLEKQIESGFPFLPSGCRITLDRVSQRLILDNVKSQLRFSRNQLIADIRSHGERRLTAYLSESGRELPEIYKSNSWTGLVREAGLDVAFPGPGENYLLKRTRSFAHVDDPERVAAYSELLDEGCPHYDHLPHRRQLYARMLVFTVWPDRGGFGSFEDALISLRKNPAICEEIHEVMRLGLDASRCLPRPLGATLDDVPLFSHATYKREEILAALGWATIDRAVRGAVTGVQWCDEVNSDVFFVNLHKSDSHFSATTMYKDYALGPQLFHWESQNKDTPVTPAGRRYITHQSNGTKVLLFTRDAPNNELGAGAPFRCLGHVDYVSHKGEKPIGFTWRLHREMPAEVFASASAVAI